MWIIKIIKIKCFYRPRIPDEHWCIYSCLQIPPRVKCFQYVRRVYATAINFPCIITLVQPVCAYCVPVPSIFHYKYIFMICALSEPTVKISKFRSDNKHYYHIVYKNPLLLSNLQWEPENCGIWRRHLTRIFWCFVTTQMVLL